jgi:endogenous inhibitor of DNA gyrase (YacG/DUF329 family)
MGNIYSDSKDLQINCPSCNEKLQWSEKNQYRPFCSERCRQLDFCGWAKEEKVLQGQGLCDDIFSDDLGTE